jgi:hypothetical protein
MQNENYTLINLAWSRIARVELELTHAIESACCNAEPYIAPDIVFSLSEVQAMTADLARAYSLLRLATIAGGVQ